MSSNQFYGYLCPPQLSHSTFIIHFWFSLMLIAQKLPQLLTYKIYPKKKTFFIFYFLGFRQHFYIICTSRFFKNQIFLGSESFEQKPFHFHLSLEYSLLLESLQLKRNYTFSLSGPLHVFIYIITEFSACKSSKKTYTIQINQTW